MSRALFIGRSVLDVLALVDDFPGPDGKTKALANDLIPGGSSLNAAIVFSHMGGDATLATSMGAEGLVRDFVTDDLKKYGIELRDICDDPSYHIPLSTVVSTRSLGARMIVNGAQDDCNRLKDGRDLFASDYNLIQLDQYEHPFVEQNFDDIRAFDGPVILDGGSWKEWSPDFLRLADVPVVSEVFLPQGPHAFAEMCNDLGLSRWAITRGTNGVIWQDGGSSGEIPAIPVTAVDTLGAGDIFHGAFCHAYAESGEFVEALNSANRIAARSCEFAGTRSWMRA
ncbi:PfkB family carbohydrate kinase [Ruegeria faecimaris]|uniref:PfkB family carbohydrate kinase n=1 Tax=Ruegeria faecimaris TaxID=686389 RepID=UPI0024906A21|nr:PfkB family carbohydrate kinase [Ruegeria faecimaris]